MRHGTPAGLRAAHGRGARGPPHPALVHRRARPAQVLRHLARRARERLRGGHDTSTARPSTASAGCRRATCSPGPTPTASSCCPGPIRTTPVGPDVLRHRQPRRHAVRGRPPPGAAAQPRPGPRAGLLVLRAPRRWSSSTSRDGDPTKPLEPLDTGSLLRPHHRRRGRRPAQAHHPHARGHGHPGRVLVPRGRPEPARDRPALHRRPRRWPTTS